MSRTDSRQALPFVLLAVLLTGCASGDSADSGRNPAPSGPSAEPLPGPPSPPPTPVVSVDADAFSDLRRQESARRQKAAVLVRHYVRVGETAMERGRLRDAQRAFSSALEVDPTHGEARRLWIMVSGLLGDTAVAREAESRVTWDTMRARIDQMTFLARERFRRARHFHGEGRYDDAILEYHKARILLETNPQADADFDALRIKAAIQRAEADKAAAERADEARRIEETHALLRAQDARERRKVKSRVRRLWRMANEAYDRGEYSACEQLCEKIIELDPTAQIAPRLRR